MSDVPAEVEWSWVVFTISWSRLHCPVEMTYRDGDTPWGAGRTLCGRSGDLNMPGIFSRSGLPRCAHCCDRLGWPRGEGSPKNDETLRPLVAERIGQAP